MGTRKIGGESLKNLTAPLSRTISVLVVLSLCAATVTAQEYRATLTGFVADAQGLALPGVTVTATDSL